MSKQFRVISLGTYFLFLFEEHMVYNHVLLVLRQTLIPSKTMSRNVFQAFNDDELPETREPDDGSDSEGEEFNYTYPPDEDLPDDDLDSDEEYVLTEMGPVLLRPFETYGRGFRAT
ncbi:hypothetical protein PoB_000909000 [Plakobranchus ocellatus]|uniref:Uncharacterized protein n=1 Tax=Plakobranchus ocellatus TaxID=259542 RepID=A0AAV3YJA6_9GAST|nr:hypothetical protein PoB_000909000 [Plakobranchus ocellatus]